MADIGTVLGGRYRLVELLGQGGMATIYRARDNQLQRDVAVKVLRPEYGADPDFVERFRNEAQSAASLNHPSVVAVYDYGTDPAGPFIVMELVDGEDLATLLRRTGPLPPRAAARLVAQAARAVAAAHERGFVHRDIKPGNILVTPEGRAKVADFGIARALSESALTLPGTTLGSVHYFSPEQARGELATPASDIYSLGIVLYELLTGRRPWTGDTAAAIATARLTGPVPSPSAARAGIPPALEAIDRKALATNPAERYGSAAELAEALEAFAGEDRADAGAGASGTAAGSGAGAGPGAIAGAAGAAAAGAALGAAAAGGGASIGDPSPTLAAGVARPNPDARIDYPPDAYASAGAAGGASPPRGASATGASATGAGDVAEADEASRTGPWLWLSAILAIAVLALAAFFVSRLIGGPGESVAPQVAVPNLVGKTFEEARQTALTFGLKVEQAGFEQSSTIPIGGVTKQDPAEGTNVDAGTTIRLTVAIGPETTVVPDLRLRTEADAVNLIRDAGLVTGVRTEDFDLVVPAGSIVSQQPAALAPATRGSAVDYVVSKGPEPTPTPSPTPVPTPTPPPPTPPPPTPPTQLTVGEYRCVLLTIAQAEISNDGFTVGTIHGENDPAAWVTWQDPAPGLKRPPLAAIELWATGIPQDGSPPPCPQQP